ncbi:MAG: lysophospholipid acyltransferase family protein [Gammaproteobacteria bacterium]
MPEYYLVPKKFARAFPALGRASIWLEAQLFRFLFWFFGQLSVERASSVAAAIVGLIGPHTSLARNVHDNLAVAFPDWEEQDLRRTTKEIFRQLGMAVAELSNIEKIWSEREQRLEFCIDPLAQAHFDSGGASVFVTAHVGAWQVVNLISRQQNLTITVVFAEESNPRVRDIMHSLRQAFGVKLLPTYAGVRPLLRELNAGNSIGLAMDTRLDSVEPLPFFGVDALTNTSVARLALRSGAALIPVRGERLRPGHFRVSVMAPIASPVPDAQLAEQAIAMTQLINEHFEEWIRAAPDHWMCLKRRWPKTRAESSVPVR